MKHITKEGMIKLKEELFYLITEKRPHAIEEIARAKAHGDLRENAEYDSAKEEQSKLEIRIKYLEDLQTQLKVIDISNLPKDIIKFGSKVKILNLKTNKEITSQILSDYEAEKANTISILSETSPVSQAIMDKKTGSTVEVNTPVGLIEYKILEII
jgi:transcription elongation factor GreA